MPSAAWHATPRTRAREVALELLLHRRGVRAEQDVAARVGGWQEVVRVAAHERQLEAQLAQQFRGEHAQQIRARGVAEAGHPGEGVLCAARAAHHVRGLEHCHLQASRSAPQGDRHAVLSRYRVRCGCAPTLVAVRIAAHVQTGAREEGGSHKAVVAAAHDDDVRALRAAGDAAQVCAAARRGRRCL